MGVSCNFVSQTPGQSGLPALDEAAQLLPGANRLTMQKEQYLMVPDYSKEKIFFYEISTGELVSSVDSLRNDLYFFWHPDPERFVLERIWKFTGEVQSEIVATIPYTDPDREENHSMHFPKFEFLNDQYVVTSNLNFYNNGVYIIDIKDSSVSKVTVSLGESEYDSVSIVNCIEEVNQCIFHTRNRFFLMDVNRKEIIRDFHLKEANYIGNAQMIPNTPYIVLFFNTKVISSETYHQHFVLFNLETGQPERNLWEFDYHPHRNNEGRYLLAKNRFFVSLYDFLSDQVVQEYHCPEIDHNPPDELNSAIISDDGQYVVLGCANLQGTYKLIDDTGEVYVFRADQPDQYLYKIEGIGLGGTDSGRNHADVFFFDY